MASLAGVSGQYSKKSSAVKRIMQEARELVREPSTDFAANPLETDIFEWHFTIRGPQETDFEGGLYHGRILLPNNYPFAPPSLMFLTPNGRFELHKKVCLSITGYHPEYWQPAWGIRTVLVAVMGFLPTESKGAIGGLDTSVEARKRLAIKSKSWTCPICHLENVAILPDVAPENVVKASLKADEMPPEFSFGYEGDKKKQQQADKEKEGEKPESLSSSSAPQAPAEATKSAVSSTAVAITKPSAQVSAQDSKATTMATAAKSSVSPTVQDPPRVLNQAVHTPSPLQQYQQPQPQARFGSPAPTTQMPPRQVQTQTIRRQQQQQDSSIPIWLDALILGFGGILVALIVRRFL